MKNRYIDLETKVLKRILRRSYPLEVLIVTSEVGWYIDDPERHDIYYCLFNQAHIQRPGTFHALPGELPMLANSVDLLVLPHVLLNNRVKNYLIHEWDRVLKPEGKILFFGVEGSKQCSVGEVCDLLRKNSYRILRQRGYHILPALGKTASGFLDDLLGGVAPALGHAYWLLAKKQIVGMKPIRKAWKRPARNIDPAKVRPVVGRVDEVNGMNNNEG